MEKEYCAEFYLQTCFECFPLFSEDFTVLEKKGIIERNTPCRCELKWTKSKTSLAKYFNWIGDNTAGVPGGFWSPIENTFNIERNTLRKLVGRTEKSGDFEEIEKLVGQHRNDGEALAAIKTLIDEYDISRRKLDREYDEDEFNEAEFSDDIIELFIINISASEVLEKIKALLV
jgi:hypothetical protein